MAVLATESTGRSATSSLNEPDTLLGLAVFTTLNVRRAHCGLLNNVLSVGKVC